ncbi:MAG: REP-associated tyrosine transposase, partial [Aridibacter sp.]
LISRLVTNVKIPLMLDSTEWEKMEAGLEYAGGKCILNSTNYEDGEERFYKVLSLCKDFGAAVVIGLIDEEGMARTTEDKVRIARRAYKDVVNYGIEAHDIFFDPLALPISTGIEEDRKNAAKTIAAIKQIKEEMPEANIILGVSNISFGLNPASRVVLNSVFLHDAVEAGMNSAIVNASKILPLNRFEDREIEVARELIYDKRRWNTDTPDTPVRNESKEKADRSVRSPVHTPKKGWHSRGYLPHFDGDVTQFITFRLADSLPQNVLNRLRQELENDKIAENSDEYRERSEKYLDQGIGSCILKDPAIAEIVEETIQYEHEKSCKVISWVIMPNHVHLLLRPFDGHSLSDILKRIKGVSARKINKAIGSNGSVWQPDYFDRFIRDHEHFLKTLQYIENNPVKAGLCETPSDWAFGSANRDADTPVRTTEFKNEETSDKSVRVPGDICTYDPLIEFTTLFQGKTTQSMKKDTTNLSIEEKLKYHIIDGEKIGLEDSLNEALKKYPALDIINIHLLGGMKVVGELFGSGQMQLPFVLQSAESMKAAVKFLEPFMDKVEGESNKGVMVLATVKGDVHDIGKNLVDIILTNNGYKVVNLGIKQHVDTILNAAVEHKADAIGMSGLLVKSTLVMRDNLEIMNEREITTPVVLGGAALNRRYVDNDLIPLFNSKLFYARDAFDGLNAMDELTKREESKVQSPKSKVATAGNASGSLAMSPKDEENDNIQTVTDEEDLVGEDAKLGKQAARVSARQTGDTTHTTKSDIQPVENLPIAPFYGSKVVEIKDLTKVFDFINETALFKGQWQYKQGRKSPEEYQKIVEETVLPKFAEIKAKAIANKLLEAKLVYGYYPCQSEGNDLIIYQDDEKTEIMRFTFPRQPLEQRGSKNLCLADFFASKESGKIDVVPFHLVTMGRRASEHSAELFKNDDYTEYLLFHGLSVESAEALAEMWHKRIRTELGIADQDATEMTKLFKQGYQGSRYSFGYPACPNIEDQAKLFELLKPERIGVELTDEFMLEPEQSTSAIILHHPDANYFNVE